MEPNKPKTSHYKSPLLPQNSISDSTGHRIYQYQDQQNSAANVIRAQIETIYDKNPNDDPNPYHRTHTDKMAPQNADYWNKYHSAWQTYYQKYYQGYYEHHFNKAKEALKTEAGKPSPGINDDILGEAAIYELKQKLTTQLQKAAKKVRHSRHFIPLLAGLIVVIVVLFIQYNSIITGTVAAYITPGNIDPQNIIVDPDSDVTVSAEPRLIIPKINVDAPVKYDVGNDFKSQIDAMSNGLAHFAIPGASSHPGQIGNTVISGHSSNDLFDNGEYKFIFAQLDRLVAGDIIYANYNSKRYTYVVTDKTVVKPTNVSILVRETTKPIMTLITCTPVGTAKNRLLVFAEQIKPNPSSSETAPTSSTQKVISIPGNSPTLIERIFGR